MTLILGLDIGGSSLKLGAWRVRQLLSIVCADPETPPLELRRLAWQPDIPVPAERDYRPVCAAISTAIKDFCAGLEEAPAALGIGSCGIIARGEILESPNTAWDYLPLCDWLQRELQIPVLLVNDADAFLLAALQQQSPPPRSAFGLILGTGIGTAFWLDGRLLAGGSGISPEAGHITISLDAPEGITGIPGSWESLANKAALIELYSALGGPRVSEPLEITRAAEAGDSAALACWQRYGRICGAAIGSLCTVFTPEAVLIGGGLSGARSFFEPALREYVPRHMLRSQPQPRIDFIAESSDTVALGGALLAARSL
ncbi:ROK family protein [bacterium]|nr:ROK family protein [bacterium]